MTKLDSINVELQLSIQLTSSAAGDWGISLIRSNGLTGAQEVIHSSAVFAAHTDALTGGVEDFIQTLNLTLREFNQGDFIYVSISFGSAETGQRIMNYNISPSPTESFIMIRRFDVAVGTPISGLTQAEVNSSIDSRVDGFARNKGDGSDERMPTLNLENAAQDFSSGDPINPDTDNVIIWDSSTRTYKRALIQDITTAQGRSNEAVKDEATDPNLNVKNMVMQREVPREITFVWDNAAGEWQTRDFTIATHDNVHLQASLEYAPVGGSGTATNRGFYELSVTGLNNIISTLFPAQVIDKMVLKLGTGMAFEVPVEVDTSIPNGGVIKSVNVNPSNPTLLEPPAVPNPANVSATIDFMFKDGTSAYENTWRQRSATLPTEETGATIKGKLEQLNGNDRLDASAIKNIPTTGLSANDVKEYARTGQRKIAATDLQIKPEEVINAFEGDAWNPIGGVTNLRAAIYTASDIAGQAFSESLTQGPHLENNYVGIRIPLANKDDLTNIRLYIGENDGEDYHTLYPASGWTHLADDATYAYYTQQVSDHPAGDWFGIQSFTPLRLDDESGVATIDAILKAGTNITKVVGNNDVTLNADITRHDGAHILNLLEGVDVGVNITDTQADKLGVPVYLPLSTLNINGKSGVLILDIEYRHASNTITNFGFTSGSPGDENASQEHEFFASRLLATEEFVTGGNQEGIKYSQDLYSGSTKIGTADLYITRSGNGRLGYYLSYDAIQAGPTGGTVTVQANLTLSFLENDPGSSGGDSEDAGIPDLYEIGLVAANQTGNVNWSPDNRNYNAFNNATDWYNIHLTANATSVQGVTIANNRITFANAKKVLITGSLAIEGMNSSSQQAESAKILSFIRFEKVESPDNVILKDSVTSNLSFVTRTEDIANNMFYRNGPYFMQLPFAVQIDADAGDSFEIKWRPIWQALTSVRIKISDSNIVMRFIEGGGGSGGGGSQTLTTSHYQSTLQPSLASTQIALDGVVGVTLGDFLSGSDNSAQGLTRANNRITVARAGAYSISFSLNISCTTATGISAGGARNYIDYILYIYRNNAKENVKSSRATDYIRRPSNANASQEVGPADESFRIAETLKLEAGDAIGIDLIGKHLQSDLATPPNNVSVAVAASNSELRIVNTEHTLS